MSYDDKAAVDQLHSVYGKLKEEIGQVIVPGVGDRTGADGGVLPQP
jgi:hypothetical protein